MNRDEAKQLLPIIQAFAEGKTVQCRQGISDAWEDVIGNVNFLLHAHNYRIKPEPKLRPWKPEEAPRVIMAKYTKDDGFGRGMARVWEFDHDEGCQYVCTTPIGCSRERVSLGYAVIGMVRITEDGTEHPCGVLEAQP